MTEEIKNRLEQMRADKVPDGYIKTKAGMMPTDWNVNKKAKEIFKSHTDKKHDGSLEILAATQENGIVPRSQIDIDIKCSDEGISGYKKVDAGDFIISLRSFQGGIEYSPYSGILSPAYTVLKPVVKIADEYYKNYFKTEFFISRLNGAVYGIRDGKQIGYEDFGNLVIHNPPLPEQQKIAEILMQCDEVIELQQCQIEEIKKLKKACLTKMFPKDGSNIPEIRFPGFTDAWEQRKYSDIIDLVSGQDFDPSEYNDKEKGIPYLTGASCIENGHTVAVRWTESPRCIVEHGDTVLVCKGSGYGSIATVDQEKAHIARQFMALKAKKTLLDTQFNYWLLNSVVKHIKTDARGLIVGIARDAVLQQDVAIPTIEEQAKVGEYFSHIDHLITLHQRELEEMQQKKKALMQLLLTGVVRVST